MVAVPLHHDRSASLVRFDSGRETRYQPLTEHRMIVILDTGHTILVNTLIESALNVFFVSCLCIDLLLTERADEDAAYVLRHSQLLLRAQECRVLLDEFDSCDTSASSDIIPTGR